ncbi:MAG: hypothetical protein ACRESO_10560 [Gammaproteobacteria bacterium]
MNAVAASEMLVRLKKRYPTGRNWRKKAAEAEVELPDGTLAHAEVHWYEAYGIGQIEHKIKHLLN